MKKQPKQLYWAYGSNLNIAQMKARCPAAEPVAPLTLPRAILRFRGVADVAFHETAKCPGGLWRITPACEEELDMYEGVAHRLYEKRYIVLRVEGRVERCLLYKMLQRGIMPPSEHYLDVIIRGYRDFGLPLERLDRAVEHSWNRKDKTPAMRRAYRRRGEPTLAYGVDLE